jgi:hypothetical protein
MKPRGKQSVWRVIALGYMLFFASTIPAIGYFGWNARTTTVETLPDESSSIEELEARLGTP